MDIRAAARAVGGLLSIIVLLTLVSADVLVSGVTLDSEQIWVLLVLTGALLGLDVLLEHTIGITIEREDGGDDDESF